PSHLMSAFYHPIDRELKRRTPSISCEHTGPVPFLGNPGLPDDRQSSWSRARSCTDRSDPAHSRGHCRRSCTSSSPPRCPLGLRTASAPTQGHNSVPPCGRARSLGRTLALPFGSAG